VTPAATTAHKPLVFTGIFRWPVAYLAMIMRNWTPPSPLYDALYRWNGTV
jgi:hypothetical protein